MASLKVHVNMGSWWILMFLLAFMVNVTMNVTWGFRIPFSGWTSKSELKSVLVLLINLILEFGWGIT